MGGDFHAVHIAIARALCLAINSILRPSLAIPEGYLGIRLQTPFLSTGQCFASQSLSINLDVLSLSSWDRPVEMDGR